jgi:hypothetical protein
MARSDLEVAVILNKIYSEKFGGKTGTRYLITWTDIRSIYGYGKLYTSRFELLKEAAMLKGLYLFNLEDGVIVVIRIKTVDRYRKVPKHIIDTFLIEEDKGETSEFDSDDE